jgi:quercetin dioxygenase-like cupin family protein
VRLFRFDPEVSRRVEHYDSWFLHHFLSTANEGDLRISVMHFRAGDHVGCHQTLVPQLFAVVAGEGWVQAESQPDVAISAGQAAFWEAGEWHAARTDGEMTAVVIEGNGLNPAEHMHEA